MRKRDSQRNALYAWEKSLFSKQYEVSEVEDNKLSHNESVDLSNKIWHSYFPSLKPPFLTFRNTNQGVAFAAADEEISLPIWSRTPAVICHETAHSIIYRWAKNYREQGGRLADFNVAGYGPEYATLLANIFSKWNNGSFVPMVKAGMSQRPRKVKFARPMDIPQPHDDQEVQLPIGRLKHQTSFNF